MLALLLLMLRLARLRNVEAMSLTLSIAELSRETQAATVALTGDVADWRVQIDRQASASFAVARQSAPTVEGRFQELIDQGLAELDSLLWLSGESEPQAAWPQLLRSSVTAARVQQVPVRVTGVREIDQVDQGAGQQLARAVAEAVTNVARHDQPQSIVVEVSTSRGQVFVRISPDVPISNVLPVMQVSTGLGSLGMDFRMQSLGGQVMRWQDESGVQVTWCMAPLPLRTRGSR
jgi:hypothetical protein